MRTRQRRAERQGDRRVSYVLGAHSKQKKKKKTTHTMNENGSVFTYDSVSEFFKILKHFTQTTWMHAVHGKTASVRVCSS